MITQSSRLSVGTGKGEGEDKDDPAIATEKYLRPPRTIGAFAIGRRVT